MFFDRRLQKEEVCVTFAYGPIFGKGTVDGIFGASSETTERLIGSLPPGVAVGDIKPDSPWPLGEPTPTPR